MADCDLLVSHRPFPSMKHFAAGKFSTPKSRHSAFLTPPSLPEHGRGMGVHLAMHKRSNHERVMAEAKSQMDNAQKMRDRAAGMNSSCEIVRQKTKCREDVNEAAARIVK